jgi:hypothetical protein
MTFVTMFFFFLLAIKGGEVFTSFAGVLHQVVGFIVTKGGVAELMCRMTMGFSAPQTCTSKKHNQKPPRKHPARFYIQRPCRHSTMTIRRHSTVAWKMRRQKTRLKLALCLTNLPIIINAKASSPYNTFPEGVSFDTDSFPIAIDSGSTYCLSNKRLDFEGALTRVNVKIQGITESKGISKWKGTARWKIQDDNGKTHDFTIPNTLLVESLSLFAYCPLSTCHKNTKRVKRTP